MKDKIIGGILLVIIIAGGIYILLGAAKKQEAKECQQWARQAEQYPGFYYANWQKAQCNIK